MYNLVLSPIDPNKLADMIAEKVSEKVSEKIINDIEKILTKLNEKPEEDKLLTISEAADLLKLTVPTVYSKVSRKEIPAMKNGKRLFFSTLELLSYLRKRK
jgi:excisionase family DNA binding protein